MSEFNVGVEQRKWAIADGLGAIPKDDPETWHRNFNPPQRGSTKTLDIPKLQCDENVFYKYHIRNSNEICQLQASRK